MTTSTTRRSFVQLAAAATCIAPARANLLDAELIALSDRLEQIAEATNAAAARNDDATAQVLSREGAQVFAEIQAIDATTIAGMQAKGRALFWLHGEDGDWWDCAHMFALVENLLTIGANAAKLLGH